MRLIARILGLSGLLGGAALFGASCIVSDPVLDDRISSLGPEKAGVPQGPLHRPGQPCLACHGGYGPGPLFTFAGTVYATPTSTTEISGARVNVTDATGRKVQVFSACSGNVYSEGGTPLVYPLRAEVECDVAPAAGAPADAPVVTRRSVMQTRISRDGSCATCHSGDPSATSPGRVSCDTVDLGFTTCATGGG